MLATNAPDRKPASRVKVSVCAGMSPSVAELVNVNSVSSLTVLFPMGASVGRLFTSLTVRVMVSAMLNGGEPLSVTRIVTG